MTINSSSQMALTNIDQLSCQMLFFLLVFRGQIVNIKLAKSGFVVKTIFSVNKGNFISDVNVL